jgi:hypothetical protein
MACCLIIQCIVVGILLDVLVHMEKKGAIKITLFGISSVLSLTLAVLFVGNILQMIIWAGLFRVCGEFENFAQAFYHSVVNFSTLGYGDLVMSEKRRLLGALEATNGVLMVGLTASFLFLVLSTLMYREWDKRMGQAAGSRQGQAD